MQYTTIHSYITAYGDSSNPITWLVFRGHGTTLNPCVGTHSCCTTVRLYFLPIYTMDNFPILSPNCGTIDVEEHQVRFNEQILFSEMYLDGVPLPRSHDSRREFYDYVTSIRLEEAICRLEKIEDDRCDWDSGSDPIIVINGAPFVPNERTLEVVCCDDTVPSFQLANRDEFYEFLASHKLRMLLESDVSDLVNWQENLDSTRTPAWLRK